MKKKININSGTIIVPMTLVDKAYYDQIISRLIKDGIIIQHYILIDEKSTILKRLKQRGELDNSWPCQQVDRCLCSFQKDIIGIKINTDKLSIEEVVEFILKQIKQ